MALREARQSDIRSMHGVRLAVRENALSNPDRITGHDYLAALDALGRCQGLAAKRTGGGRGSQA